MDVNQRRFLIKASTLMGLLCFFGCSGPDSEAPLTPSVATAPAPVSTQAFVYRVGPSATYCLSSEATRSVRLEGLRPDDQLLGGFDSAVTGPLSDITWTQTVQAVDPNGQALILIEISGLRYQGYRMGELVVDYDSTRPQDTATALEDLIGLAYHIRMDAKGQVVQVLEAEKALAAMSRDKAHFNSAAHLLSEAVIKARHQVKPLNAAPDQLAQGETWTSPDSFGFGRLGGKAFEKTYVCQSVDADSSLVEITMAEFKSVDKSVSSANMPMLPFTSEDQFTGDLILDTRAGQVKLYRESLEVNWSFVDPASMNEAQPRTGHMTARQGFLLERKESAQ